MGQTARGCARATLFSRHAGTWRRRARAILGCAAVAIGAASLGLQPSPGYGQTLPCETSRNPNELLAFGEMKVPRWIAESVARAAQVTNVDPVYLMALADKESSFLPESRARTSSAVGLFQFIDATWLAVIHRYGSKYGFAAEAEAISFVKGDRSCQTAKTGNESSNCAPFLTSRP